MTYVSFYECRNTPVLETPEPSERILQVRTCMYFFSFKRNQKTHHISFIHLLILKSVVLFLSVYDDVSLEKIAR